MMKRMVKVTILAVTVAAVVQSVPDIKRYIRIRTM